MGGIRQHRGEGGHCLMERTYFRSQIMHRHDNDYNGGRSEVFAESEKSERRLMI